MKINGARTLGSSPLLFCAIILPAMADPASPDPRLDSWLTTNGARNLGCPPCLFCAITPPAMAAPASPDPRLDSWLTTNSGKYARIYTNAAAKAAGNSATTWSNGSQNQTLPAYCGPQEILS